MVLLIGKTWGMFAVAPRFSDVSGPGQRLSHPYAGVAALRELQNERLLVHGTPTR